MMRLSDKIDITNFELELIDISELELIINALPKNGVIDLNIAEEGLVSCLWAQNFCQEHIIKIDRIISRCESEKDRKMAIAGLQKAVENGYKTAKDKDWYARSDDDFIEACSQVALAKAGKKFFEHKASFFSGWYFAFKTFLSRDYNLERLSSRSTGVDNGTSTPSAHPDDEEIDW